MMKKKMMFAFVPVLAIALWGCPAADKAADSVKDTTSAVTSTVKDAGAGAAGAVKDAGTGAIGAVKDGAAGAAGAVKDGVAGLAGDALGKTVTTALGTNKELAGITVKVDDKMVSLQGTVPNNDLKKKAGEVAQTALTAAKSTLVLKNQLIVK
jgi:osmotically-inducible protein OsmY